MQHRTTIHQLVSLVLATLLITGCADEMITQAGTRSISTDGRAAVAKAGLATYEVTVTNLTEGQPLTPPLLAVHRQPVELFAVGEPASTELQQIAENGNLNPTLTALNANKHVVDVVVGGPPPLVPAGDPGNTGLPHQTTAVVTGERGAKYISMASMLICTNDGFTGVNGQRLPKKVGDTVTLYTDGYDAGTELNTEDFADLVPPCQALIGVSSSDAGTGASDPALAESESIRHHPGIKGSADLLPAVHGWNDPVARIEIVRTN